MDSRWQAEVSLSKPISQQILRITNSDEWTTLKEKYLGATPR
jgi:hypothetical protein